MKGDFHVRFCERLAGEIPACLLDRNGGSSPQEVLCDFGSLSPARSSVEAATTPSRWDVSSNAGACGVLKYVDSIFTKRINIMDLEKKEPCRKMNGKECSFEFKTFVIEQINNGQISLNFASKKYNVSRSTLDYWRKKLSNYKSKEVTMSKDKELKKLRERIEELEFVKEFQQDLIANFELVTGQELSKKYLPEQLSNEIQKKKHRLSK
jgi:transposase-like protein